MSELQDIAITIARIETKQDALLEKMDEHLAADEKVHDDHEQRVRVLERSRWRQQGLTAFVATLVSGIIGWLLKGGGLNGS
jgi:hypothetical protein